MEVLHLSIYKKVVLAVSLVAFLFFIAHVVGAQNVAQSSGQDIVVDTSHAVNSFSAVRALGGAVDRQRGGITQEEVAKHTDWVLSPPVLKELLGAGWGMITYRQNTELQIQAWHWNPRGTWSNPAEKEGYFVGSADPTSETDRALLVVSSSPPGEYARRRIRMVSLNRRQPEQLLEEQSLPYQKLHGRR